MKPALQQWCAREPADARPFRCYGRYYQDRTYLLRALAPDPTGDTARETLLGWWLYSIYCAVHHPPKGYLGDLVREHIRPLASPGKRAY